MHPGYRIHSTILFRPKYNAPLLNIPDIDISTPAGSVSKNPQRPSLVFATDSYRQARDAQQCRVFFITKEFRCCRDSKM